MCRTRGSSVVRVERDGEVRGSRRVDERDRLRRAVVARRRARSSRSSTASPAAAAASGPTRCQVASGVVAVPAAVCRSRCPCAPPGIGYARRFGCSSRQSADDPCVGSTRGRSRNGRSRASGSAPERCARASSAGRACRGTSKRRLRRPEAGRSAPSTAAPARARPSSSRCRTASPRCRRADVEPAQPAAGRRQDDRGGALAARAASATPSVPDLLREHDSARGRQRRRWRGLRAAHLRRRRR